MYTYVKSLTLSRRFGATWSEEDRLSQTLQSIFQTTVSFFLTLKEPVTDREVYVDMNTQRDAYGLSTMTVEEWLTTNGNTTLPTVDKLPDSKVNYAFYSNAIQAGYKIDLVRRGFPLNADLPLDDRPDVLLTRPGFTTNMPLIHTRCLVTIGGLLHNTDTDGESVFVVDAGKVLRKKGHVHMGLLSFLDIGRVHKVKIKPENIHPVDPDRPLVERLTFTVDTPLDEKSFMFSFGGYLVTPEDNVFWRSGENTFTLNVSKLNLLERYLDSKDIIDLSSLGLPPSDINPNVVAMEDLFSDETIKKYMTLSQSFLVVVDTPFLAFNKIHLRPAHVPGKFSSPNNPVYPLLVGYGRMAEYWRTPEAGNWSLSVPDSFYRHFLSGQQPTEFVKMVSDHFLSCPPFYLSRGYMLEIVGTPTL